MTYLVAVILAVVVALLARRAVIVRRERAARSAWTVGRVVSRSADGRGIILAHSGRRDTRVYGINLPAPGTLVRFQTTLDGAGAPVAHGVLVVCDAEAPTDAKTAVRAHDGAWNVARK